MIGGAKGIGIGIDFGIPNQYCRATSKPYIEKDVLDSLRVVASAYGKSNDDADRSIVKNLVDASNPFIISNAAFKLNSGFGKYEVDFTSWIQTNGVIASSDKVQNSITGRFLYFNTVNKKEDVPSFKVNITLGQQSKLQYNYIKEDGTTTYIVYSESGIYTIPASYFSKYTGGNAWFGFYQIEGTSIIEQIPSFEGAFVTDGIDDLIKSTKSATEMLDGSNEVTVVSMIHQIKTNDDTTRNNWFFTPVSYLENRVVKDKIGKTGIYGYTSTNVTNAQISDITPILGDKNDYTLYSKIEDGDRDYFTVEGFQNQGIWYVSSIAWYWTIIANKVLTTDQINQVIAYFNLDRTLNPDILCNTIKQGITNENHAEFGDKLIDFSGNGRDIQLNNIAWKGDSGIGKYETDFTTWTRSHFTDEVNFTPSKIEVTGILTTNSILINNKPTPIYNVEIHSPNKSIVVYYQYNDDTGVKRIALVDGINELPSANDSLFVTSDRLNSKGITITQIPSHAGALCLDGVNDFGKVTGMPIYKDYTFIADRYINNNVGSVASKSTDSNQYGAFIFEIGRSNYSFNVNSTVATNFNKDRTISYLSKYSYNGENVNVGNEKDSDLLWIGTIRDNETRFSSISIYSLMSFPYSMSKFLIERQLKKHKLGTLYPNMVEFRPVIKANANYKITYYQIDSTNTWKSIKVGDYIVIGAKLAFQITFDNDASELKEVVSPQLSGIIVEKRPSNPGYNIYSYITSKSPQKINITIDEYIRYEDIVQPYPVLLRFKDENGNEVSWGGKFRVGSTITRIGSIADPESNLLNGLYSISGLSLNGKAVTSSTSIVEKQMVFRTTATWLLDNNEPKCILSPSRLRIPNSSYKLLGYIPDISGHRNHGKINNSAYAGMSGANGYKYDYKNLLVDKVLAQIDDDKKVTYFAVKNSVGFFNANSASYKGRIKLTGVKKAINDKFIDVFRIYTNSRTSNEAIDIYEDGEYDVDIKGADDATRLFFFALTTSESPSTLNTPIVIEQIGEYEGAYCFDGVDDFVTIPTLSSGGKQVLMKVNWQSIAGTAILYDQRTNGGFAIFNRDYDSNENKVPAYRARNTGGSTYIDGILNKYIYASQLKDITHNIVELYDPESNIGTLNPKIGSSYLNSNYAQMALYDFMLFDEISTDDKIKELNEYVGIEAKVELPPYYWDAYGKTNLDEDKATIQQRGVAIGDYDLINNNFAYEGMSGYNGYPAVFGTNKTYANLVPNDGNFILTSSHNIINVTKFDTSYGLLYSHIKLDGKLTSRNIDYPSYKIKVTGLGENFGLHYSYLKNPSDANLSAFGIGTDGTYTIPKSFASDGSLINNNVWIGFIFTGTAPKSCNVTIEVLPEYENGLAYDGVSDFTDNKNIPILTDFTFIIKREILGLETNGSMLVIKGDKVYNNGIGNAFILEHNSNGVNYVYSYGKLNNKKRDDSKIIYLTPESYNGNPIIKGENGDSLGLILSRHWKGIIYKTILYSKTISLLEINFLKNLMEKDEIIDLNNKIFIQE